MPFHAQEKNGILVILQSMDAAGKDEIITFIYRHILPQALRIFDPDKPSETDRQHDFLWRFHDGLPARGEISVMNRSYYEDVLSLLVRDEDETIPAADGQNGEDLWRRRCRHINEFEKYLIENGFQIIKLFPLVSKEVQKKRLLERMRDREKQWEFSFSDLEDRARWDGFHTAYDKILRETSTEHAPWYILPADNAWFTRLLAARITVDTLEKLAPSFPEITGEKKEKLEAAIRKLSKE